MSYSPTLVLWEFSEGPSIYLPPSCFIVRCQFTGYCVSFWFDSLVGYCTCLCFLFSFYTIQRWVLFLIWSLCFLSCPPKLPTLQTFYLVFWSWYVVSGTQAHFQFGSKIITVLVFWRLVGTILTCLSQLQIQCQKEVSIQRGIGLLTLFLVNDVLLTFFFHSHSSPYISEISPLHSYRL